MKKGIYTVYVIAFALVFLGVRLGGQGLMQLSGRSISELNPMTLVLIGMLILNSIIIGFMMKKEEYKNITSGLHVLNLMGWLSLIF